MSGVNAHATLRSAELQNSREERLALPWQRLRQWFAPPRHAMLALSTCAKPGDIVAMVTKFGSANLVYLRDHQV